MGIDEILKMIFGLMFVLFLPGLVWSYVFFDKGEIEAIERMALSIGMSVAIVPLVVFWVHWIFEIQITLINVTLITSALIGIAIGLVYMKIQRK